LVPGASRCFIVKGGITLTGITTTSSTNNNSSSTTIIQEDNQNSSDNSLDWAIPLVQSILQQYAHDDFKTVETMSASSSSWPLQQLQAQQQEQENATTRAQLQAQVQGLAAQFPHVMDVRFLNLQQELENQQQPQLPPPTLFDGNVSSGGGGNREAGNVGIFSDGDKVYAISSWTWVVVSFAGVFVLIYALFLCKRRACACCCANRKNGRHASHYRLENGNGDDDDDDGDEESEAVLAHAGSHDRLSLNSGSGGFRSWSRRCQSRTMGASGSLEEDSLTGGGPANHLELDRGGGIYHHSHVQQQHSQHDITGEPPVVVQQEVMQQMEQASLISGTFVEASVTSLASRSFQERHQQQQQQYNNGPFPGMENTIIVVEDESGIVGNNDDFNNGNAYIDHRQATIDVLDDIASSLSADDAQYITIFPQPLSIPTSSSPSSNSNTNDNMNKLNDLHHFETDFDVPILLSTPELSNNNDPHTMITASSADDDANNMVLHYHDPNDPTRPPIDLNNIVYDLEQLANAPPPPHTRGDDINDNGGMDGGAVAVSIDDETEDSDLTASASSDDKNDSNDTSGSSSGSNENDDDGSSGDWKATIA
jgi:hypothetical protein